MKVARAIVEARRESIASLVAERGYLPVQVISREFGISEATVRRDLDDLVSRQRVTRTHGGALSDFNREFASLDERRTTEAEAKRAIGRAGARLVGADATVYIDAGTTPLAVAEALAAHPPRGLRVLTPSLSAAKVLGQSPGIEVHLPGGLYLGRQEMLAGPEAAKALRGWRFDLAFVGAEGLDSSGLHNSQADIVAVTRELIRLSQRVVVCLTRSKVGVRGPVQVCPDLRGLTLLTDATAAELSRAKAPVADADRISIS